MIAGVSADDRATIARILAAYADRIDRVALFGSRATGLARPNSDIDLVIYGDLGDVDIDRLWTLFDDSALSVSVDVLAYNRELYPPLRRHIDRHATLLLERAELTTTSPDSKRAQENITQG